MQPIPNPNNAPDDLIMIHKLVSEIFMFESVDPRTDRRRFDSLPINSLRGFASGELKYHNHKLQTNLWYRKEESHNNNEAPGRQTNQSDQLSLPDQDDCKTNWNGH